MFPIARLRRVIAPAVLGALVAGAASGAPAGPALFPIEVGGKHGMIDRAGAGAVVIPPEYAAPIAFREGLARVARGSKVAYLDAAGAFVIPPQDAAREGLAAAKLDTHYGYVDRAGTWAISPRFAGVHPFHQGLAWVGEPGARGAYVDAVGRVVSASK